MAVLNPEAETETRNRFSVRSSILEEIGNTPLLRIRKCVEHLPDVALYAKLETFNPGGSVKDRPALQMIRDAEASGDLTPEKILIDSTSGNTGIAYAMIGAALGYRVKLVMPENVSVERRYVIRSYGADLVLSDPVEGSDGAILKCREIVEENPGLYYKPDQYNNPSNSKSHYLHTAPEIWSQTEGRITHFVASLGTSGTVMGTGRRLKEFDPDIRIIAVEPPEFHGIEGLKNMDVSIVPGIYDPSVFDEKIRVETEDAYEAVHVLTRELGILAGQSSGAALVAALRVAERAGSGVIVTLFPDSGEKYLSTPLWRFEEERPGRA